MNRWRQRRVLNMAHQGGAREGPSNTMYAMRAACANGAHVLELDVHLDADDVLVVAHDADVRRMTGMDGRIRAMSQAQLADLDAAHQWAPGRINAEHLGPGESWELRGRAANDPSLRIPTLASVLEQFPSVLINLEVKAKDAAAPLAYLLAAHPDRQVIVTTFRDWWLRPIRRHDHHIDTAPGVGYTMLFWLLSRVGIAAPTRGHVALQMRHRLFGRPLDRRFVSAAHRRDLAVHAWTVDDPDDMHAALDADVDGIMTDRPAVLRHVLDERGLGWMSDGAQS